MSIGNKIKEARFKCDLTQEEVAESIGVSRQTISNWETSKSLPDVLSIIKISELYKLNLDELLKGDKDMIKKIEKDTHMANISKRMMQYAWLSIILGTTLLILGRLFKGNFVIDFLSGATPWVLLGLSFLFAFMYIHQQNEE